MSVDSDVPLLSQVATYYSTALSKHGPTSNGVDWNSQESHALRHCQFLRLIDGSPDASILDLGCGFGDFLSFLRAYGHRGAFVGYDIAPSMIVSAISLHGEGVDRQWRVGSQPEEETDFAIASGIFNVKGDVSSEVWSSYVHRTIDKLAGASRKGFAFNMLSLSSDPERRRANLYYADPSEMLAYCLTCFGRSVAILQDYGLYEFTVIVRHADTPSGS